MKSKLGKNNKECDNDNVDSSTVIRNNGALVVVNETVNNNNSTSTVVTNGASKMTKENGLITKDSKYSNNNNNNSKNDDDKNNKNKKKTIIMKGKTYCVTCKKKCSGEVLKVQDKYFHTGCFKCKVCDNSLAEGGFFFKNGSYYCTSDYQRQFGTKCAACNEFVQGEVISALGKAYHENCFKCAQCRLPFPTGEKVTYTGKDMLCKKCVETPVIKQTKDDVMTPPMNGSTSSECAGCHMDLSEGQALIALDKQWHIWCFKCHACVTVLHGEYMGKDGVPYCEKDYQKLFGVKCAYCSRFISGKVLQAGDNHHFHPTCARCTKCGDPFGDGEEMYLQGGAIWHPRCGPGPTENGTVINGGGAGSTSVSQIGLNGHLTDTEMDHISSSGASDTQFSLRSRSPSYSGSLCNSSCNSYTRKRYSYQRAGSPGLLLREYKCPSRYPEDISRIYTYSYLTEEPSLGYLKRPIDPYDKPPTSPHFHRPASNRFNSGNNSRSATLRSNCGGNNRSAMKVLVDSIRSETPRPKSPFMNNEEPIELAHFPAAKPPHPNEKPKIERDDFPAPPYPYSDPERRKKWCDTYKGVSASEDEDELDSPIVKTNDDQSKLKKEEKVLSKISSGIGKVFLQEVKERERMQKWKQAHIDPRNASRCPSASREPAYRLRYQSPVNASPSRNIDHPRPWEEDEFFDHSSSYPGSSVGRSTGAISSYNAGTGTGEFASSSSGPGTNMKSCTLPATLTIRGNYGANELTGKAGLTNGKSNVSANSLSEVDRGFTPQKEVVTACETSGPFKRSSGSPFGSAHIRRSLPNMSQGLPCSSSPPKIYPYHLLMISNYRLPADVDRLNLERHLSDVEFETLFQCNRDEFYHLPQWRRNELKRRARLF